ncbi:phage tail protein, partial [Pseudomonas aeruginosa]|nr:phage tail protein [Pseudomonas aeruginosa]
MLAASALQAIADQANTATVPCRWLKDEAATNSAVIGSVGADGKYTGMKALLAAKARLGVVP